MNNTPVANEILCQQCTAVLPVEPGSQFVVCQYCDTTNFVDKSKVVLHYLVRVTVQEQAAVAALRRWMGGNATVKDLDKKADIESPQFEYFPMWVVRVKRDGQEQVFLQPAAALSVSELKQISLPAADLEPYAPYELDGRAVEPTVPYETMREWLTDEQGLPPEAISEVSLVHLPIYICKYSFDGERYTAVVDGATSAVFANIFPSKWEMPYLAIGIAAFVLYFCAAWIPVGGYMFGDGGGLSLGIIIYLIALVVLAIPIFVVAAFISAKV